MEPEAYWLARKIDAVAYGVVVSNSNSGQEYVNEKELTSLTYIIEVDGASIGATVLSSVTLATLLTSLF